MPVGLAKSEYVNQYVTETLKQIGAAEKRDRPDDEHPGLVNPNNMQPLMKQIVKTDVARGICIYLFNLINGWLKREGMNHDVILRIEPIEGFGTFSDATWEMTLNKKYFDRPTIGVEKLKEQAVTLYHECRHAEQAYLMIRYVSTKFPKLSPAEIQQKLSLINAPNFLMNLDAIKAAQYQKLEKSSEGYSLGEKLYQGEFAGFLSQQNQGKALPLDKISQTLLTSTHPRVAANTKHDNALAYVRQVKQEIKAYNQTMPTAKPNPVDVRCGAAAERLQKSNPPGVEFLRAYQDYLQQRRIFAISQYHAAHVEYTLASTENDAHEVETAVRTQLDMRSIGSKVGDVPVPKDWTAVTVQQGPPPPSYAPPPLPVRTGAPPNYPPPPLPGRTGAPVQQTGSPPPNYLPPTRPGGKTH